ncbi:MAG: HAD family hydrolase [Gammaproteobacteria bacterium]
MKLIVFDLDGTLTETYAVDEEAFVRTMADEFGIENMSTNWAGYPHATDLAIVHDLHEQKFGREPDRDDIERFKNRMTRYLQEGMRRSGGMRSIAGVSEMLETLNADPCYAVAIATGAFDRSAELKFRSGDLDVDGIPIATSDDGTSRADIVRVAVKRAKQQYGCNEFERVVCVGDGTWDLETARELGYGFIGIGTGTQADMLRRAGAVHVIGCYSDLGSFLSLL